MTFKIGNEVKTTCAHYGKHFYSFEGIVDDIQGSIISVYGHVYQGLGQSDDKYLRDIHVDSLELSNYWFEKRCWICNKVKMVHDDERCTFDDPEFVCEECELARKRSEKLLQRHLIG